LRGAVRLLTRQLSGYLKRVRFCFFDIPKFSARVIPKDAALTLKMKKIARHSAQPSSTGKTQLTKQKASSLTVRYLT